MLSEEDEAHPYEEYPTSNPPLAATNQEQRRGEQHQEQQVYDEAVQQSEQQRGYVVKNYIYIPCTMDLKKHTKKCFK